MKPITDMMREYRKGALVTRATDEMANLVRAVQDTGRPGEVTITFKVKPNKNERGQVMMSAEVKTKTPREEMPDAIFYTDDDGGLHRTDPHQRELFIDSSFTPNAAQTGGSQ